MRRIGKVLIGTAVCACTIGAQAVIIDTVVVGNAGNPGDPRYPSGGVTSFGGVDYTYSIGRYEVTAGQYADFLNAVAAADTYELYKPNMWTHDEGCRIEQSGSWGSHTYSVAPEWANRPVNFTDWGDAARFANWLHNGQPTGPQGLGTTEDGSYFLNGATTIEELFGVTREPGATWVIPSEDEWYKAAYHKNDGVTGNYWNYPTGSNSIPSNQLLFPDPGNNANFYQNGFTIGGPYWRTEIGVFVNSASPYGTFDQGGNVWEWNEATLSSMRRGNRGSSYDYGDNYMHAAGRDGDNPAFSNHRFGFRVALVPEPAGLAMLGIAVLLVRRR